MSLERGSEANPQDTYAPPEVVYMGEENAPFYLDVDEGLLGQMYQELGLSSEQASNVRVRVFVQYIDHQNRLKEFLDRSRDKVFGSALGSAVTTADRDGVHEIRLYPCRVIDFVEKSKKTFLDYSRKCDSGNTLTRKELDKVNSCAQQLFITKRLVPYLKDAGGERSARFLDRIFPVVVENYLREILAHEGQHLYEIKNDRFFSAKAILPLVVWYFSLRGSYDFLRGHTKVDMVAAFGASIVSLVAGFATGQLLGIERRAGKAGGEFKRKASYLDLVYLELNEWKNLG